MRIAVGCDDFGFPLKSSLISALESEGHVVLDLGSFSTDPVDYPDYARAVGQAVLRGFADVGVLLCASGVGAAIAANKLRSVRAAFCPDVATARLSREQADANVLCLTANAVDSGTAVEVARAWVSARFLAAEPHARRVAKIAQLDELMLGSEQEGLHSPARESGQAPEAFIATSPTNPATQSGPPTAAVAVGAPAADDSSGSPPDRRRTDPHTPTPELERKNRGPDALHSPLVDETLAFLEAEGFLDRLWTKDTSLWRGDPAQIGNGLGWLTAPTIMRAQVDNLRTFADEIRRLQFSQVIVLGMGAASLCTEVFSRTFDSKMGFPDLLTMDSTDPAAVKHALDHVNVPRTLFVVSSKSGTTIRDPGPLPRLSRASRDDEGDEAGHAVRRHHRPRDASLHDREGHRLPPHLPQPPIHRWALRGAELLRSRAGRADRGRSQELARPGSAHGRTIRQQRERPRQRRGTARRRACCLRKEGPRQGDLVLSEKIQAFGAWLEQLLAESLGKDGMGVVPVVDEPLGDPAVYGPDRLFVAITIEGDASHDAALDALAAAGHPVIRLEIENPLDVGAEFFRWEVATATAGAILGVNPFDEPDIARTTNFTERLLTQWKRTRRFPDSPSDAEQDGIVLTSGASPKPASVAEGIMTHLAQAGPADYLAILAYVEPTIEAARALQTLRMLLRDRLRIATTLGFGPRYLHSTGQLHKEGPPTGLFIQITGADREDLAIPGAGYDFSTLKAAQILGDLDALRERGRRVIRLQLLGDPSQALPRLVQLVRTATRRL